MRNFDDGVSGSGLKSQSNFVLPRITTVTSFFAKPSSSATIRASFTENFLDRSSRIQNPRGTPPSFSHSKLHGGGLEGSSRFVKENLATSA